MNFSAVVHGIAFLCVIVVPAVAVGDVRAAGWTSAGILAALGYGWVILGEAGRTLPCPAAWAAAYILGVPAFALATVAATVAAGPGRWPAAAAGIAGLIMGAVTLFIRRQPFTHRTLHSSWPMALAFSAVLATALPFAHVGAPVPQGTAYRAYFDHDFLVHLAVSAELAHGRIPPSNPYYAGEPLHYYWLPFNFAAAIYRAAGPEVALERILLLTNAAGGVAFALIVYGLLHSLGFSALAAGGSILTLLFAGSYEGAHIIGQRLAQNVPVSGFSGYNIDGWSRWLFGPPQIDTLFRGLLFTPQHLLALGLFALCAALLVRGQNDRQIARWRTMAVICWAAAAMSGCSAFIALAFAVWLTAVTFVHRYSWQNIAIFSAVCCAMGVSGLLWLAMEMFATGTAPPRLAAQVSGWPEGLAIFALNFGAPGILGVVGLIFWHKPANGRLAAAVLALLALIFIFGMSLDDYENEFGLRGGFLFFCAMSPGCASVFARMGQLFRRSRAAGASAVAVTAILLAPGLLTTALDLFNSQDISNSSFTLTVTHAEREALNWIRQNTPPNALIQAHPERLSADKKRIEGNLIPPFGQRGMFTGTAYYAGQFQIGKSKADERVKRAQDLLRSTHPGDLLPLTTSDAFPDFWWLSQYELAWSRDGRDKFFLDFIEVLFDNGAVKVIRADGAKLPAAGLRAARNTAGWFESSCAATAIRPVEDVFPAGQGGTALAVKPFTGFDPRPVAHSWIFDVDDVRPGECLINLRQLAWLIIEVPAAANELLVELYWLSCASESGQWVKLTFNEVDGPILQLRPGWRDYRIPLPAGVPRDIPSFIGLVPRDLRAPREVCGGGLSIGATGRDAPGPVVVRGGPAPGGGLFGDVFWEQKNISPHQPGFNLVPLPPDVPASVFDTTSDPRAAAEMANWLRRLPHGQIVAGVTLGAAETLLTDEGWRALETVGVSHDPRSEPGSTLLFIGVVGAGPGTAAQSRPAQGAEFIHIGPNEGTERIGFAVGAVRYR